MARVVVTRGASAVVIDDGAPGVLIATWFDEPTVALVDAYFDWHETYLERVRKARGRFVSVTDTYATKRPSPTARRRIAERMDALGDDATTSTIASYVIVESALLRGAITALSWLHAPLEGTVAVGTPALAIEAALRDLDAAGIPRPARLTPQTYQRPAPP